MSSLPVPVSPWIRTAQSVAATALTSSRTAASFGLDPIISVVDMVSPETDSLIATVAREVRIRLRSLARDPFLNEARTVLELDSAGFADGQEFHRVAIDVAEFFEIDRPDAVTLGKRVTKNVQRRSDATAADTEDHAIVFGRKPVDSARHGSVQLSVQSERPPTNY